MVNKYRIFCNESQKFEFQWGTVPPSQCPIDGSHAVNHESISQTEYVQSRIVTANTSAFQVTNLSILADTTNGDVLLMLPPASRPLHKCGIVIVKLFEENDVYVYDYYLNILLTPDLVGVQTFTEFVSDGLNWSIKTNYEENIMRHRDNVLTVAKGALISDDGISQTTIAKGNVNDVIIVDPTTQTGLNWKDPRIPWAESSTFVNPNLITLSAGVTDITSDLTFLPGSYRATFDAQYELNLSCTNSECAPEDLDAFIMLLDNIDTVTRVKTDYGNGETLFAGGYFNSAAVSHTGLLILDGQGDPNSIFLISSGAAFSVAAGATMNLINEAQPNNVFFYMTGAISIAAGARMIGNIIGKAAISTTNNVQVTGRLLTTAGAISNSPDNILRLPTTAESQITMKSISEHVIFTKNGDVTGPSTSKVSFTGRVASANGTIINYKTYDGTFTFASYAPITVKLTFGIYIGDILQPSSKRTFKTNFLGEVFTVATSCVCLLEALGSKIITAKVFLNTQDGGVIILHHNLFVQKLSDY